MRLARVVSKGPGDDMPRSPRFDSAGRWFHVMNRGLARRTIFENRRDVRYFLSRLAYAVRRGELGHGVRALPMDCWDD